MAKTDNLNDFLKDIADATNPIIVHTNLDFHHLIQVDITILIY